MWHVVWEMTRRALLLLSIAVLAMACSAEPDPVEPDAGSTAVDGVAEVPLVIDLPLDDAIAEIERAGLVAQLVPLDGDEDDPRVGVVVEQTPAPFGWLPEGSVMRITVGE